MISRLLNSENSINYHQNANAGLENVCSGWLGLKIASVAQQSLSVLAGNTPNHQIIIPTINTT